MCECVLQASMLLSGDGKVTWFQKNTSAFFVFMGFCGAGKKKGASAPLIF